MTAVLRLVFTFTVLAALVGLSTRTNAAQSTNAPQLIEQRPIELPNSRILAISPDGAAIAAATFDLDFLCIYEVETLAERTCADLAPLESRLRLEDVVWSPDSTKLALAEESFVLLRDGDLWIMDAVTGELTNLTDDGVNQPVPLGRTDVDFDELYLDVAPAWLPDSSAVTFSRSTWRQGDWTGNTIMTVPVTGGEPKLLTRITPDIPGVVYFGMRWTADASTLYYTINYPEVDHEDNGVWRIDADGTGAEHLIGPDSELGPPLLNNISPDGDTVLVYYAMAAAMYDASSGNANYALLDVASGEVSPIEVQDPDAPSYVSAWPATLSPDGNFVLYATRLTDPQYQVIMSEIASDEATNLVPEGLEGATVITLNAVLTWSNTGVLLMGAAGPSTATLLTIEGGTDFAPVEIATPVPDTDDGQATPQPVESAFAAGDTVTVNDNDVPLRAAPGTDALTVATLSLGTELTVVGPAVEADGRVWVPVTDPATGTIGYVRAEFIEAETAP